MTTPPPSTAPAPGPAKVPGKGFYLLISLAVLILDQWTKWWVQAEIPMGATRPVIPGLFNLIHVENTGVAFGLFAEQGADGGTWLLIVLGLVALAAVAAYFRFTPAHHRLLLSSLGLIVGGALGNLFDRVAAGAVTDFLDVHWGPHHWPAFNVADSAITVGIVLMLIDSFRSHRELSRQGGEPAAGSPPADGAVEGAAGAPAEPAAAATSPAAAPSSASRRP